MDELQKVRYCKSHKNKLLDIIHVTKEDTQHELCYKCYQLSKKYQKSDIVYLSDILDAQQDSIITNYPPFEDQEIHSYLSNEFYQKVNEIQYQIDETSTYFQNLQTNIDAALKIVRVEMDKKILILEEFKNNLIATYNQVSSKEQIKNICKQNSENLNEQVHELIFKKFDDIKSNTQQMQQSIKQFNDYYDKLSFQQPKQIHEILINLISKIDFFSNGLQSVEYSSQISQIEQENNINEVNEKQNTELLIDLISNKTNYCSSDFINQFKQIFNKYAIFINQTKINCNANGKEKRDCFQNLNDQQLENIRILSQKIQLIDQQYNNNNLIHFSDNIQPSSNQIVNNLKINQYDTNLFEQTFKKYPIFELDDLKNTLLSQRITFIKSEYNSSSQQDQEISIVNGKLQILKINKTSNAICYSNIILDVKNKYIIRLHIQTNPNESNPYTLFGLIEDNKKDNSFLSKSGLTYNEKNSSSNTLNKIIKGNVIASGLQKNINKQIEIRLHLEDKLMRIATYPDYENVSELDDKNKIDQNIEYRFAISLWQLHDKITINEIFIVDQFDNKM